MAHGFQFHADKISRYFKTAFFFQSTAALQHFSFLVCNTQILSTLVDGDVMAAGQLLQFITTVTVVLGDEWGSCRQFRWPTACDCSCWRDSHLPSRLKSAYRSNSSSLSLQILQPYFRDRVFLSSWMWILVNAIKGSKKSQDQVNR